MNAQELQELCAHWDTGFDGFAKIVQGAIDMAYERDLASAFEVAVSTVSRWASGAARPDPRIQKLIVDEIARRTLR